MEMKRASAAASGLAGARPMTRATRITLFEREVRERLSPAALDVAFERADLLSEGQPIERGNRRIYFGSTMMTLDLAELAEVVRESCDAATARRFASLLQEDASVATRVRAIAEREAVRVAGRALGDVRTHVTIYAQGAKVFLDIDVEGDLA
jgi:hypothetical protein